MDEVLVQHKIKPGYEKAAESVNLLIDKAFKHMLTAEDQSDTPPTTMTATILDTNSGNKVTFGIWTFPSLGHASAFTRAVDWKPKAVKDYSMTKGLDINFLLQMLQYKKAIIKDSDNITFYFTL